MQKGILVMLESCVRWYWGHCMYCGWVTFLPSPSLLDMVGSEDLVRVGRRMMESNPSLAALGDLTHVPERREVEEALFTSGGVLKKKRRLFSFGH